MRLHRSLAAWLLGGSWYYVLAGIGFIAAAILIIARRAEAAWLHALIVPPIRRQHLARTACSCRPPMCG
jgi:hypothetical protein